MTFSLSGTTITQTGTDTDLSGLSGIAGVVTNTVGVKTFYFCDHRIQVDGALSWDNTTNELVFTDTAPRDGAWGTIRVTSGGVLKIGDKKVIGSNSQEITTKGAGLSFGTSSGTIKGWIANDSGVLVDAGGSFSAYGCHIDLRNGSIEYSSGALGTLEDCVITDSGGASLGSSSQFRFNNRSELTEVINCEFVNISNSIYTNPSSYVGNKVVNTNLLGYGPKDGSWATEITIKDFNDTFAELPPIRIIDQMIMDLHNSKDGPNSQVWGWTSNLGTTRNAHYTRWLKDFRFKIEDEIGGPVEGAKLFIKDTNNGARKVTANFDDSADNIYEEVSLASGFFPDFSVVTAVFNNQLGAYITQPNSTQKDFRTKANDSTYIDVAIVTYNYQLVTLNNTDTSGLGISEIVIAGKLDTQITETDKTIVDTYTTLETAQKFYDYAKSYLVDNYAGEAATIVTRVGDTIQAGSYDVVIDTSAPSPFAFDGTTITIKAGVFVGGIATTGNYTELNGAITSGLVQSANGDSALIFQSIDNWTLYPTAADRVVQTNAVASGTAADLHRFVYVSGQTYYLRVTAGGITFEQDAIPSAAGETVLSLSEVALLSSLNDKADAHQAALVAEHDATQAALAALTIPTPADIYTEFTAATNADAFKADVSNLSADVNVVSVAGAAIAGVADFMADLTTTNTAIAANASAITALPATIEVVFNDEADGTTTIANIAAAVASQVASGSAANASTYWQGATGTHP